MINKLLLISCFILCTASSPRADVSEFMSACFFEYQKTGECPKDICTEYCSDQEAEDGCGTVCLPRPCPEMPPEICPEQFCVLMKDCAGREICHHPMVDPPSCGDLAYGGQDVACCEGFVRRCGIDFLDGSCDMEGFNSIYNIPICIPCGDGICTQFENICNCPEDCGKGSYKGVTFDGEAEAQPKPEK